MTTPMTHEQFRDLIAEALTDALPPDLRAAFDAHAAACPPCAAELASAQSADAHLMTLFAGLRPAPDFEQRMVAAFKENAMPRRPLVHPFAKRLSIGIAASLLLGATGAMASWFVDHDALHVPAREIANRSWRHDTRLAQAPAQYEVTHEFIGGYGSHNISGRGGDGSGGVVPTEGNGQNISLGDGHDDWFVRNMPVPPTDIKVSGGEVNLGWDLNRAGSISPKRFRAKDIPAVIDNGGSRISNEVDALKPDAARAPERYAFVGKSGTTHGETLNREITDGTDNTEITKTPTVPIAYKDGKLTITNGLTPAGTPAPSPAPSEPSSPATVSPPPPAPPSAAQAALRKIIRTGTMEVEVRSFDDASATIAKVVIEDGGFVSSTASDKLANGKVRGTIVVRVPPEKLDTFVLKLRALGDIKSQQIAASDVSKQYTDTASELRALRAMEERLLNIIKTGKGEIKDLVEAEKQLADYRVRIEKLEGELRYYDNLIGMSTMTITCYERDIAKAAAFVETENVTTTIETEDVDMKYRDARKAIEEAKGRIVDSELKKQDAGQFIARIVADVPPDHADAVTAALKQLGNVVKLESARRLAADGTTPSPTDTAPAPKVEQKDTRFVITMYNLANIGPRQTHVMTLAVPDVDEAYNKLLARVRQEVKNPDDPKKVQPVGRVVSSTLQGQQPDQKTADLRVDVRASEDPAVLADVKALGEILNSTTAEAPDNATVTAAKAGFQLRIVAIAAVAPRETHDIRALASNVPDAFDRLLKSIQRTKGPLARVLASTVNQQDPRNIAAELEFEVPLADRESIRTALADAGIEINADVANRSTDTANTTDAKVRYAVHLRGADQMPAARTVVVGLEVDNVPSALASIRGAALAAGAREADFSVTEDRGGKTIGRLIVELPAAKAQPVLDALRDLHGDQKVSQVTENPIVKDSKYARQRIEITLTPKPPIVAADEGFGATFRSALKTAAIAFFWIFYFVILGALVLGPILLLARLTQRLWPKRKPTPTT